MQLCRLLLFFICFKCFFFFLFTSQLSVQTVIGLKKLNQKRQKKISSDHIIPSQFLPLNQSPQSHLYCSGLFVLLKHFLPFKHGFPVSQMVWETNNRRQKVALIPGICRLPKGLTCRHKPQFQKRQNQKCYFIKRVE